MERPSLFALLALLFTPSCVLVIGDWDHARAQVERDDQFDADGVSRLRVECRNGSIQVARGGEDIACHAKLTATARDAEGAERLAAEMFVTAERSGDLLRIYVDAPAEARNWSAAMRLSVPAGLALDLDTSNGRVVVEDSFSSIRAETSNASIQVLCDGDAELETSNASVRLAGTPRTFDIRTSNASAAVELAGDWSGRGKVRTSNGSITIDCAGRLRCATAASTSNGSVHGVRDLRGEPGVGDLVLRTSNASIRVNEQL
ncbi:MAG: hypothetical protein ISR76_04805 [Planctomycetes bacterium]|nr:hypothetical protein [Planctomycetota bacterium]